MIQKLDRQVFKYAPDQMILRLNQFIDEHNRLKVAVEVDEEGSNNVIIIGKQPDGTFGIKKWIKQGDVYTFVQGVM